MKRRSARRRNIHSGVAEAPLLHKESPGGAGGFLLRVYLLGLAETMLLKSLTAVPFTATIL